MSNETPSLVVAAGGDERFEVLFYLDSETGIPRDLTGYTVTLVDAELATLGQVALVDAPAGKAVLSFTAMQSAALKPRQRVRFKLTDGAGSKMQSWFLIDRD